MNRIILFCITALFMSLSLNAQEWEKEGHKWYSVPSYYINDDELCVLKLTASHPCNTGKEPFTSFLKKFNKDRNFRRSRCMTTEYSIIIPSAEAISTIIDIFEEKGGFPIRGFAKKKGYDKEYDFTSYDYGFWHYIDRDYIVYSSGFTNGLNIILLFQRLDGQWYCTDTYPCQIIMKELKGK